MPGFWSERRRARGRLSPERLVELSLAPLVLLTLVATYTGAADTWDGGSFFYSVLDGQAFWLPHHRFGLIPFQLPILVLSRFTSNVRLLELVHGFSYTVVPALFVWTSLRLVSRRLPRLIVWQLAFVGVGALPGQMFFAGDSLIALHAIWPLLFVIATGFSRRRWALAGVLAAFLFGVHPIAGPLFGLSAALAIALAIQNEARRRELVLFAALAAALGIARVWVSLHDPYEVSQAAVHLRAEYASLRLPRVGVTAAWTLAPLLFVAHTVTPRLGERLHFVILAMLAVVLATFLPWARNNHAWQDALDYRFLAPFAAAPFLVGAALHAVTATPLSPKIRLSKGDGWVALAFSSVLAAIVVTECASWLSLRRSMEPLLARSGGCISMNTIPACRGTALKWWPTPEYALTLQGRKPRTLLLAGRDCARRDIRTAIRVNPWYSRPRDGGGWFDLTETGLRR